jgi:hypothetical protein
MERRAGGWQPDLDLSKVIQISDSDDSDIVLVRVTEVAVQNINQASMFETFFSFLTDDEAYSARANIILGRKVSASYKHSSLMALSSSVMKEKKLKTLPTGSGCCLGQPKQLLGECRQLRQLQPLSTEAGQGGTTSSFLLYRSG